MGIAAWTRARPVRIREAAFTLLERLCGLLARARWALIISLFLAFSALLAACNAVRRPPCPVDDKTFCEFVSEIEPLFAAVDADALLDKTALECCKGDYAWPDETTRPGFDPDAPCIRSGAFRGESGCRTAEEFQEALARHAPLSVEYLVATSPNFAELRIPMSDMAVLVGTRDPEQFLVVFTERDADGWAITAILDIRRAVLDLFPADSFFSWPLDLETPRPPPRATQGLG